MQDMRLNSSQLLRTMGIFVLLVVLISPTLRPLFHQGFFPMHDDQQIVRLAELDQALRAGQFPVRWVDNLGFGYGYPLFIFYPPLVYYLGELFHVLLATNYIVSMKMVFGLSFIGATISMYFWAKRYFGVIPAVVAGIFYSLAPYRAVDAYVRGALAEAFSFVWLPLILLGMDGLASMVQTRKSTRKKLLLSVAVGVSYALLMITHNLIVLPFTLIMVLFFLLELVWLPKRYRHIYFLWLIPAGLLGISLSAFFWLPSLAEMEHTLVDQILLVERYDHSLHYVAPQQLWNSLWGYGGSSPDLLDGFSFKVGKIHLIGSFVVAVAILMSLSRKFDLKIKKFVNSKQEFILSTSTVLLLFCIWMTTESSAIIWDNFQPIQFLQFPWRFLTFIVLFSSLMVGGLVWMVEQFFASKVPTYALVGLLLFAVYVPNIKLFQPAGYLDVTDEYYLTDEFLKWHISKTSFEFVPKGVETTIDNELGITQLAIDRDQIALDEYHIENGEAQVTVLENQPDYKAFQVTSESVSQIMFNTFNFPGWKLFVNGQETAINDTNRLNRISTILPKGEQVVEIKFTNTPIRTTANLISLLGWLSLLGIVGYPVMRSRILKK